MTPRRLLSVLLSLVLLPFLAAGVGSPPASAEASGRLFTPLTGFRQSGTDHVVVRPQAFRAYTVDMAGLRAQLAGGGATNLSIPAPDGEPVTFTVSESSILDAASQAAHPEIRTYSGANAVGSTIRLDVTPLGFHAMVRQPDGVAWYVDPAEDRTGETRVLVYDGAAVGASPEQFVERDLARAGVTLLDPAPTAAPSFASAPGGVVSQRTYRLAFLTDPTYATYFGSANVLAAKTALINRVDEVYNDDLGIHFTLDGSSKLNLDTAAKATQPNGPCGADACFTTAELAGCDSPTLDRNGFVLGQLIGADNYDIGHIGLGVNGGGIAGLGVVGTDSKAQGCTGLTQPNGDFYAIDYVAHEMGHEMGGDHTFNGTQLNCSTGNRNTTPYDTQVEPGSGSSIMAYAGICGTDDLQPHSDPYFSLSSVDEINATTGAAPGSESEEQVVNFSGLDVGEKFTLSCTGCPTSGQVTYSGNAVTDTANITAAVLAATGTTASVSGYDGATSPSAAGFTADFFSTADVKTLTVQVVAGSAFTSFTGTIVNGGPDTNTGTVTVTTDHSPKVTAPAAKTIPTRTPFTLTGAATDADAGDTLTYMWEQNDPGGITGTGLVDNNKTDGPLFRQFGTAAVVTTPQSLTYHSPGENLAGTSPSRTFPDLAQILAGNTNAATGSCPTASAAPVAAPIVDCYSEFLPTTAWIGNPTTPRVMHFRLTARDEFTPDLGADHPGGLSSADVAVTVDPTAGPFQVTSRAAAGTPTSGGSAETVTWAVNGTNTAALAPNVKISLSTDGGLTFPTVLSASTPNDGSEVVTLPTILTATSTARIKIEAVGNYFFDINDADFTINPGTAAPTAPDTTISSGPAAGSFVLTRKVGFSNVSSQPGSTFVCTLDRKPVACADTAKVKFKPGTHTYAVAAKNAAGIVDPTPATVTFASPYNDGQLTLGTRGWVRHKDKGSYRGGYSEAHAKGQVLTKRARRITSIALVVHTGKGFGRVAVYLGKKKLKTVSLAGASRKGVLVPIKTFAKPGKGVIRIVTLDHKTVRIDGLGIFTV